MLIKQLSVFVENKLGRMAEITELIGNAGVDIRALSIADTSDFGILRLIVDKPDAALDALKQAGVTVTLTDVIAVGIEDKPGAFAKAVKIMSDAGIGIEYMYAFISRSDSQAFVIMRIEDLNKGIETMRENGIKLLTSDEIYNF